MNTIKVMDETFIKLMNTAIGKRVKLRRELAGIKSTDFAIACGINPTSMWAFENGDIMVRVYHLYRIAAVLKCAVMDLMPDYNEIQFDDRQLKAIAALCDVGYSREEAVGMIVAKTGN